MCVLCPQISFGPFLPMLYFEKLSSTLTVVTQDYALLPTKSSRCIFGQVKRNLQCPNFKVTQRIFPYSEIVCLYWLLPIVSKIRLYNSNGKVANQRSFRICSTFQFTVTMCAGNVLKGNLELGFGKASDKSLKHVDGHRNITENIQYYLTLLH